MVVSPNTTVDAALSGGPFQIRGQWRCEGGDVMLARGAQIGENQQLGDGRRAREREVVRQTEGALLSGAGAEQVIGAAGVLKLHFAPVVTRGSRALAAGRTGRERANRRGRRQTGESIVVDHARRAVCRNRTVRAWGEYAAAGGAETGRQLLARSVGKAAVARRRELGLPADDSVGKTIGKEEAFARASVDAVSRSVAVVTELDPLSTRVSAMYGWALCFAGKTNEAEVQLHRTLDMDPEYMVAKALLGETYILSGNYEEAIKIFEPLPWAKAYMGMAYALDGNTVMAEKILDEIKGPSPFGYQSPYDIGILSLAVNRMDEGFDMLEEAWDKRDPKLVFLRPEFEVTPGLRPLRELPRYQQLVDKLYLSHDGARVSV